MTDIVTSPTNANATAQKLAAPAPLLIRRPSSSKVGSRVQAINLATTSEASPLVPPTPPCTPVAVAEEASPAPVPSRGAVAVPAPATPRVAEPSPAPASSPAPDVASPVAAPSAAPQVVTSEATPLKVGTLKVGLLKTPRAGVSASPSGSNNGSAANTPAATPRGGSRSASVASVAGSTTKSNKEKLNNSSTPFRFSGNVSLTATPLIYRARSGVQPDDSIPTAGKAYTSRYAVSRSSLRSVPGKSGVETDALCLKPLPADGTASPTKAQSKRVMFAAYAPTAVAYSEAEAKAYVASLPPSGKYCDGSFRSCSAPWEKTHPAPGSPKRAGSARPARHIGAPWEKANDGNYGTHAMRSRSAAAAYRSKDAPYGVAVGSHNSAFHKGEDKLVETAKGHHPPRTSGISTASNPADHDVLNPNAAGEKCSPSGRRPPPAESLAPSAEYIRPLSRKPVDQVEHIDRPIGIRGFSMATAPCEASPFRTDGDNARQAALSPDGMGIRSSGASRSRGRILLEGRSGGVQSYHIDPTNAGAITSAFSPPRERPPTAKQGKSNIESLPNTDRDSLRTICPVKAARNSKESLVGVMYVAPQRARPSYDLVAPYWTE